MDKNTSAEQGKDYSIIFSSLEEAKQKPDFQCTMKTMEQSNVIAEEIERLRDIVTSYEQQCFSTFVTI
jgi:hypothetical protein